MADKHKRTTRKHQPLQALDVPNALLMIPTLQALSGLGKTKIFEEIASGKLKAVRLGKRCTRVRAGDAQTWLQALGKEG